MFRTNVSPLLILVSILSYGHTLNNGLFLTNDCPCSGYNLTFECTAVGIVEGSTQWYGDAIRQCSLPVFLRHREFRGGTTEPTVCNSGESVIRSHRVENDCYTSQLSILFSASLIGGTVTCAYDNGLVAIEIGSLSISGNKKSYPPPIGIRLMSVTQYQLIFTWNLVENDSEAECSAIHYRIFAHNCGNCPNITHYNTVACTDYRLSMSTLGKICSFSLQTVFCENTTTGNTSEPIQVVLKVPAPPVLESIVYRYLYSTGDTIGFVVQFSVVPSFVISDGIDGSAISYTLTYYNSVSGIICGSAIVPTSTCIDGVCRHSFTYEKSACSSPLINVNVTISAANLLGSGPPSRPNMVQGQINMVFTVAFNVTTNSIVCNFHNQTGDSKKFCSIDYGPKGESCSSYSQTSHSTSDVVRIGLPLQLSSTEQYCFTVTGNNSTHIAVVEGTFNPGHKVNTQASCGVSLGLSLTFFILIGGGVITVLAIVIVFLVRSKRQIQVQLMKVQTINPISTAPPIRAGLKSTTGIYEEVDGDRANVIVDVENIAYHKKDFHRRCATPCSDNSGEVEAYYTTI